MSRAHNFDDLSGLKFNNLTVIGIWGKKGKRLLWECQCNCGSMIKAPGYALKAGRPKACVSCSQKARFAGPKKCSGCNKEKPRSEFYQSKTHKCKECLKPILNEKNKKRKKEKRLSVLVHYSSGETPTCDCCGEKHIEFLTVDHIHGGGNRHRKEISVRGGSDMINWLIKNDLPDGFRILCYNCNTALGLHGYCPHHR